MREPRGFQRMTRQRRLILEVLRNTTSHPTADWVYEQVRRYIPNISLGTVYRNLKLLTEMGEIQELNYGSTHSRFDANIQPHYHFTCKVCGRCFDVDMEVRAQLEREAAARTGFKVDYHRLEFYGTCEECLRKTGREEDAAG